MSKRKKDKRTLDNVGKKNYEFDYDLEKSIYEYLCCSGIKKKKLQKMSENIKFESYRGWKQYIKGKFKKYPNEKLEEFSRYLNQRMRNVKPRREYWSLVLPVILSMMITELPKMIADIQKIDFSDAPDAVVGFVIIISLSLLIPFVIIILKMLNNMWDDNNDENFLIDYKEIIDNMLEERSENQGENNNFRHIKK